MKHGSKSLAGFLARIQPSLRHLLCKEGTQGWGPVVMTQFNFQSEPIQSYTTALLHAPDGRWFFVCSISDLAATSATQDFVNDFSGASANRWLLANRFSIHEFADIREYEEEEFLHAGTHAPNSSRAAKSPV